MGSETVELLRNWSFEKRNSWNKKETTDFDLEVDTTVSEINSYSLIILKHTVAPLANSQIEKILYLLKKFNCMCIKVRITAVYYTNVLNELQIYVMYLSFYVLFLKSKIKAL